MTAPAYTLSVDELRALVRDAVREELAAQSPGGSEILSREKVAKLLGCHVRTVSNLVRSKGLPVAFMVGAQPRFKRAEIERWMQERGR